MITQRTASTAMTAVRILRARVGANSLFSQVIQSELSGAPSRNVALMSLLGQRTFDDRNSRCAHPEKIGIGILDFDPHRETLRDAHPVQLAFHVRNSRRRQIDF